MPIRLDNTTLVYDNGEIRPYNASNVQPKPVMEVDSNGTDLYVGGIIYKMADTGIVSPEGDGIIAIKNNELMVTIDRKWFTLHATTVKIGTSFIEDTAANPQNALVTVRHGNQTFASAAPGEEKVFRILPSTNVKVTAVNLSTPAVANITTNFSIIGGIHTASHSSNVITSGSLTETGSIVTVCVQQIYDVLNSPVVMNGTPQEISFNSYGELITGATMAALEENVYKAYNKYISGMNTFVQPAEIGEIINLYMGSEVELIPSGGGSPIPIPANGIIEAPASGSYTLNTKITGLPGAYSTLWNVYAPSINFSLTAGEVYQIQYGWHYAGLQVTTSPVTGSGPYETNITFNHPGSMRASVVGPLETVCLQEETIDTRRTVDTRQTQYIITVSLMTTETPTR